MADSKHGKEEHLQLGAFYSVLGTVYEDKEQDHEFCCKLWRESA